MSVEDSRLARDIRHEVVKRCVDSSRLDIRVYRGVVYLSGEVRPIRGQTVDLKKEMDILYRVLKTRGEVRDVVNEVHLRLPLQ